MDKRYVLLLAGLLFTGILFAESDNGKFFSRIESPKIENIFFEANGGVAFPLSFVTQDFMPMTSFGGAFSAGAGYNWDGWLFGLEFSRDIWGEGVGSAALMQNFNNNLIVFKLQRVLSKNTIAKFPKWFEIVPGAAVGVDFITTDYYPSERAKDEGRLVNITLFQEGANCCYHCTH